MDIPSPDHPLGGALEQGGDTIGEDPVLCSHCGRTASNGITCQGICVADSGY